MPSGRPSEQPERWSPEESAIAVYYLSRRVLWSLETAAAVVKLRFPEGEERSASACKTLVERVCESMPENPYNKSSKKYTLEIVDEWLSREFPDKEELEKLLGIKDDKLVDEDVLKYYRKRTVTVEELARYDWKLRF